MERNSFARTVFSTYRKYTMYTHVLRKCQRKLDENKFLEQDFSFKGIRTNVVFELKQVRR